MKHSNIAIFVPHNGCPHNCSFCNQKTISGAQSQPTPRDVEAACEKAMEGECDSGYVQLAFFGGSFTAIDRRYMLSLLDAAQPFIKSGFLNGGIRISTRPDFIDDSVLSLLKSKGVKAIELGAQCMDDEVLSLNRRGHTVRDVENAARLIKSRGFELGLQMMTGLYGSSEEKDRLTAERFAKLQPATVRIYPTVILKGTLLADYFNQGKYIPMSLDETVDLCSDLLLFFHRSGIRVIRLGLHAGKGIEDEYVGGSYHPAMRELCEGEIYRKMCVSRLEGKPKGRYTVFVAPGSESKMAGQRRRNLNFLSDMGYECKIRPDSGVAVYDVYVRKTDVS